MAERIVINNDAAKHLQAYLEYDTLVGGYDNGKLMSEQEYENFKKNLAEKQENRLYVSWQNIKGNECKYIGPATKCFCSHRFKEHDYLKTDNKKIHCRVKGCNCQCYSYIPAYGSYDFKCNCKHSYTDHDPLTKKCKNQKCVACHNGFTSTWSCGCGLKYNDHKTVVQTKQERIKSGKLKSIEDNYTMGGNVPLGIGSIQKFGDIADYDDSYQKQLQDMGGFSGVNNQKAPIGYKQMQAIEPQNDQYMQLTSKEQQLVQSRKQKLNDLNKKIKQEKKIDDYDHMSSQQEDNYYQQEQISDSQYQYQNQQKQQVQPYNMGQVQSGVQGGISALTLFNTPHQFTRVKYNAKMIKKY